MKHKGAGIFRAHAEAVLHDAQHGRFKPLAKLLRRYAATAAGEPTAFPSDPIDPEVLLFVADIVDGKRPKRKKGYVSIAEPPLPYGSKALPFHDWPWSGAAERVKRYKKVWAKRYNRRYEVHSEAVSKAAADYGISEETLGNYIKRGGTRRGRRSGS